MARKQSPEEFWREYEETIGEKVLAHGMGQYVSGWQEFDGNRKNPLWGLVIATTGGFRFHHFPQTGGLLGNFGTSGIVPKEKTIFLPGEKIVSAILHKETKWYKKLLSPDSPFLRIRYIDESSNEEKEIRFSAVHRSNGCEDDIATELTQNRP